MHIWMFRQAQVCMNQGHNNKVIGDKENLYFVMKYLTL